MAVAEAILFWLSVTAYAAATILCAYSVAFGRKRPLVPAVAVAAAGLAPHAAAFAVRWTWTDRPPFINLYELILAGAWCIVVVYVAAQFVWRGVRSLGVAVLPVALLSMGFALTLSAQPNPLTAALRSWWLAVHIIFALVAYGCFAVSFGAAVVLLVVERRAGRKAEGGRDGDTLQAGPDKLTCTGGPAADVRSTGDARKVSPLLLPSPELLDEIGSKCIFLGFICDAVMILSGSIWAKNAWASYWGWDPVETWSLVTWLVYGLYVHLRFLKKWKRKHAAWLAIAAFAVVVFSFWGVAHLWKSIHDYSLYSG